jgi:hypothetical protein
VCKVAHFGIYKTGNRHNFFISWKQFLIYFIITLLLDINKYFRWYLFKFNFGPKIYTKYFFPQVNLNILQLTSFSLIGYRAYICKPQKQGKNSRQRFSTVSFDRIIVLRFLLTVHVWRILSVTGKLRRDIHGRWISCFVRDLSSVLSYIHSGSRFPKLSLFWEWVLILRMHQLRLGYDFLKKGVRKKK